MDKNITNVLNKANLDVDSEVYRKLSLNLATIESGRKDIFMTPICKDNGGEFLIGEFTKVYNANQSNLNDVLKDLESSNLAKCGPRSIAVPWLDRKESLLDSFNVKNIDVASDVNMVPGKNNLRPLSVVKAMKLLKNNTNSGLPYMTRKGNVKERVLDKFDYLVKRRDPCILFTRTQEQNKTRNVWGYPMIITLIEMCFYSPLLLYQRGLPYRSALISPDAVSRSITAIIDKALRLKYKIQSIDFSRFDTTVKFELQLRAFNYIKSLFQNQFSDEIDSIFQRFNTIGILTPDGVLEGPHGVPTGSTFTNEVDSIVQSMIALSFDTIGVDDFQVQGDDGVYCLSPTDVALLTDKFESCGLIVNGDKSYVSDNYAIYLQNLFHVDYRKDGIINGIYPVYRALNRLLYQERWSDFEDYSITGKDFYSIRAICILENCKYHPLFEELVKFILKYDKYSLVYSDKGLSDYVRMIEMTKGAGEILNHQYGDDIKGLKSFETVKLIKRLGL